MDLKGILRKNNKGVPVVVPWNEPNYYPQGCRFDLWPCSVGWRIQCCCKLWCRSQIWLGSGVAVAVAVAVAAASSCSSDSTPSLGTSMCCRIGPIKAKQNKTKQNKTPKNPKNQNKTKKEVTDCIQNWLQDTCTMLCPYFQYRRLWLRWRKPLQM